MIKKDTNKNAVKVRGALYGVAVGDALGAPVEFLSESEIKARHGCVTEMLGGGWLHLSPGEVTDDTQMMLCVARGIIENPKNPVEAIQRDFMEWFEAGPADVGNQCRSILSAARQYGWARAEEISMRNLGARVEGNGALMRAIYPPLFYGRDHAKFSSAIARITHPGPISTRLCIEYGDLVSRFIREDNASGKEIVRFERGAEPGGYVLDSFNVAMECFVCAEDFEGGLIDAVNRGGDADTIGVIYGGIAGAFYGFDAIPERWIKCLDPMLCSELDALAEMAASR